MQSGDLASLFKCNKCGSCTSVCPLYQQTVHEGMAARGKLALLEAVADGRLDAPKAVRAKLEECLLCGACAQNCPSLVPTTELFLKARADLAKELGIPLPIRLFLTALATPGLMRAGMPGMRLLQRSGVLGMTETRAGLFLPDSVRAAVRATPPVPSRPYRARRLPFSNDGERERGTVAYFAGCFMNWGYADAAEATHLALSLAGYRVESPPVVCCGLPHRVYGDLERARRLARRNIATLEAYEAIVADCASCGAALREYAELLADDPEYRSRAKSVSDRVFDVSAFLVAHEFFRPRGELPIRVTYHEPCHLGRIQGVKQQPRQILRAIPGLEFVEMKEADVCCGGAGTFCVLHSELSERVGAAKAENILATGAEVVVSGCPSCISQLRAMLRSRGAGIRVCHPIELLAESYRRSCGPTLTSTEGQVPSLLPAGERRIG
jgi:glycolate oxidase iron-sulfur subunit